MGKTGNTEMPDHEYVRKKARELADIICRTKEYGEYSAALELLKEREEMYRHLNQFRRESMLLQLDSSGQNEDDSVLDLFRKYNDTLSSPFVMRFLSAEQGVCRMMREVFDQLAGHVGVDISYMDEEKENP